MTDGDLEKIWKQETHGSYMSGDTLRALRRAFEEGRHEGGKYGWQPDVGGIQGHIA